MPRRGQDIEERIDEIRDARRHGIKERGDKEERERPSWREIDKRRDSSRHTDQGKDGRDVDPAPKDRYQTAQAQRELKAQLDGLFYDDEADELRSAVMAAQDRASMESAIDALVQAKGALPSNDPGLLERCLDAKRDAILRQVVEAIGKGLAGFDAEARKLLLLKLRNKARLTFDARLSRSIKALLAEHGVGE